MRGRGWEGFGGVGGGFPTDLCIEEVMHGDHVVLLAHNARPDPPELLHMTPDPEQQPKVNT